jgi:hypothetical protein
LPRAGCAPIRRGRAGLAPIRRGRAVTGPKRLGRPRAVEVQVGDDGIPIRVGARKIDSVLEDWLVEDRWWTDRPVRRRYLELVTQDGRCVLVFRELLSGRWFTQRG